MTTLKPLFFVSVEGFWEKSAHEKRLAEAAEKLLDNPKAFAIATATHAPPPSASFTKIPLGQYTSNKLIEDYKISPMRILPAYLFDQKTTYTIIDAYSNAIMIGWLSCGLSPKEKIIHAELTPVTAGFHVQAERILELNKRAMKSLDSLSVKVNIQPPSTIMSFEQVLIENPEEADKLKKIKAPGEVLETGTWNGHSGITRNFDDIDAMRVEIINAFSKVFEKQIDDGELFYLSDVERLLLTFMWNIKANTHVLTDSDWNAVYEKIVNYFEPKLKTTDIDSAKNKLTKLSLLF